MFNTYEDFKKQILFMTGIDLNSYKERQMKRRINALIRKNNYKDYFSYLKALKNNKELYKEFINYITINVSEFFRNPVQWEILEKEIIPYLLKNSSTIKIWSAACSTGEEPYSLAMTLAKFIPLSQIKILATDIDKQVLEKAQIGLYNKKSISGVSKEFLLKYFKKVGEDYKISDEIKNCVTFKQHDLLKDPYPNKCDLIVCRNVLIYFTDEAKNKIYKKFNNSLKTGGVLFVGNTEQIILSHKYLFSPIKTFFYKKEADIL
ncbi:CheR family methyltransferase [Defluviitalea phaphyphila]|uniref:CheR family methyltransferase n=1 Tax=Defluviitalea phaphyphila TaxID=1473580 RepID=UPI000730967B|nr:protein-glutamate O-methyltransferase CheR [Defluviitalea phaphyphila]